MPHPTLFILHVQRLSEAQLADARAQWGVGQVVYLPEEMQALWHNIPADLPSVKGYLKPLRAWLKNNAGKLDPVWLQGDLGACYTMARFCKKQKLVPIYATEWQDKASGDVKHILFRQY